jgi:hypothetical protein
MRIFPPPLELGDTEGFTPEKDIFGRVSLGKGLTNLVSTVEDPMVIAVDAQWGSGKTTFLKMWAGELRKLGFPVVYFDAFKSDYAEDAFTAIASEIFALVKESSKQDHEIAKRFLKGAKSAGKILLRSSLKIGVKAATLGVLEAKDLEGVAEDLAKESSDLADKYIGELLTKQNEHRAAIEEFRISLAELPALLTGPVAAGLTSTRTKRPLIFIIDDLDRCRPSFAIEVLERIKHFFDVNDVHFVLGVHLVELRNSISAAYGPKIDTLTYLQKFIPLTLHLVDTAIHKHERAAVRFVGYLFKAMEFDTRDDLVKVAGAFLRHIARHYNLSLRAIEQIMTALALAVSSKPKNVACPYGVLVALCVLKVVDPDLYITAKTGTLPFDKSRVALALNMPSEVDDESTIRWIGEFWRFVTDLDLPPDHPVMKDYARELARYHVDRLDVVRFIANDIVDRLTPTK